MDHIGAASLKKEFRAHDGNEQHSGDDHKIFQKAMTF